MVLVTLAILGVMPTSAVAQAPVQLTDFYGDANNVDGGTQARLQVSLSWRDLMATQGNVVRYGLRAGTDEINALSVGCDSTSATLFRNAERGNAIYDTRSIPTTAMIVSVDWYLYGFYYGGGRIVPPLDMTVYEAMPQYDNMLVPDDYQHYGTVRLSNKTFYAQPDSVWNKRGYNIFPFNSAGLALVQERVANGQKVKLGLRSPTFDVGGGVLGGIPGTGATITGWSHMHAYTRLAPVGMRPYLRIVWEAN